CIRLRLVTALFAAAVGASRARALLSGCKYITNNRISACVLFFRCACWLQCRQWPVPRHLPTSAANGFSPVPTRRRAETPATPASSMVAAARAAVAVTAWAEPAAWVAAGWVVEAAVEEWAVAT